MSVNKQQLILEHMAEVGPITQKIATDRYGHTRLAAAIHSLRKTHDIRDRWLEVEDRYGNRTKVKEYYLPTGEQGSLF